MGKGSKNAVFGIYDADTDNRMGEITTDRKGVAEIKLDPGSYYFLELEAPQLPSGRGKKLISQSIPARQRKKQ